MSDEHYFSENPASQLREQSLQFEFAGRTLDCVAATGTFSSARLDAGTELLLSWLEQHQLDSLAGLAQPHERGPRQLLDIGCGWGAISLCLAISEPNATVWAVDVNSRALSLTAANAQRSELTNVRAVMPDEVPSDVRFDEIWSNPPIRIGKQQLHALIRGWLARLSSGGSAHFVVAKQLGAESFQSWLQSEYPERPIERSMRSANYRVITLGAAS